MPLTPPEHEWKKGSAELLVLSLLEDQPRHGYDISKLIQIRSGGELRFHVTSLYPLQHRLEKEGWLEGAAQVLEPAQHVVVPPRRKGEARPTGAALPISLDYLAGRPPPEQIDDSQRSPSSSRMHRSQYYAFAAFMPGCVKRAEYGEPQYWLQSVAAAWA